ncbi:hypothetical protein [Deinococcus petrolearius]|uniref:Uncharacterized protein n=1 Tax=Deinococcus petrolearius TaxID=1751295 RepID=A0ABW1DP85_9DEIO
MTIPDFTHPSSHESGCWPLKTALRHIHDRPVLACGVVLPAANVEEAYGSGVAPRFHDLEQLTGHFGRPFAATRSAEFDQRLHDAANLTLLLRDKTLPRTAFALAAEAYMERCDSDTQQRMSLAAGYAYFPGRETWEAHAWCFYEHIGEEVQVVELVEDSAQRPSAYYGFVLISHHADDDFGSPFVDYHTNSYLWARLVAAQSGIKGN